MSTTVKKPIQESHWQGSQKTVLMVRNQIAERWGEEEAEKYDPETNCFTYNTWRAKGYFVKKGEKALRSFTLVKAPGIADIAGATEESGPTYPKSVCLFYYLQVEKREEK
jgi:hypothetical protein